MEHEATVVLEKGYLEKSREQAREIESTRNPFTGGDLERAPEPAREEAGTSGVEFKTESQAEPPQSPLLKPGWFKRR